MKKSTRWINMLELIFGLLIFTIIRQLFSDEVRIIFMIPVILLLSLPSGRYQQPILTKKNVFDMVYGFLGTLVILLIVFKAPDITNVIPTGETVNIRYIIGSKDVPIEYLTIINARATSILAILFLTIIPVISIGYTVINDIARNGFYNSRKSERKKSNIFFDNK